MEITFSFLLEYFFHLNISSVTFSPSITQLLYYQLFSRISREYLFYFNTVHLSLIPPKYQ